MAVMMYFSVGLAILNSILLTILLVIYFLNYRSLKAEFNLGLFLFAGVFLVQKVTTVIIYLVTMMQFANEVGIGLFFLEILQTFAFTSLTWITLK